MAKPVTIYGIKNCDTMKKARAWLDQHGVAYAFHDYKAAGIERGRLETWSRDVGWETLLNRAGTTFRALPDKDKAGADREEGDRADDGAAVDDQAAGARRRRQAAGRLQAGAVRGGIRRPSVTAAGRLPNRLSQPHRAPNGRRALTWINAAAQPARHGPTLYFAPAATPRRRGTIMSAIFHHRRRLTTAAIVVLAATLAGIGPGRSEEKGPPGRVLEGALRPRRAGVPRLGHREGDPGGLLALPRRREDPGVPEGRQEHGGAARQERLRLHQLPRRHGDL